MFKIFDTPSNPVTLKFRNRDFERAFVRAYSGKYLFQLRLAHILAMVFYIIAVVGDMYIIKSPWLVYGRIGVIVPMFSLGLLFSFVRKDYYLRKYQWFNFVYVMVTGISFIITGLYLTGTNQYFVYSGVMICLIFNYTFIKQDFIKAGVAGLVLVILFILITSLGKEAPYYLEHSKTYIIISNFLGMFIAYTIEYDGRKSYLMNLKIEEDKHKIQLTNVGLENLIRDRTQELEIEKEKAEESNRLKSVFLSTMSHELRTPLNAIIGFSSIVDEKTPLPDFLRYSEKIHSSGEHLLSIINDLFNISLIEAGEVKICKLNVNLVDLLNEVHELILTERDALKKTQIEIVRFDPEVELLYIYTDPVRLKQILINLLKNALKFTDQGKVEYGYQLANHNQEIIFKVKDTGAGISEEKQELIFDAFRQADESDTRKNDGVGLGLTIARKLTNLLEGEITLKSEPGKGSVFYVAIPFQNV